MKTYALAFAAGFIATLLCHQGLFTLFWATGLVEAAPYNLNPTQPFGVPAVISLAFWGGIWGLPTWLIIRNTRGAAYWFAALLFGGFGPSLVALTLVFPLKDRAFMADWDPGVLFAVFLLNAAWGLGVAACMRLAGQHPSATTAEGNQDG